MTDDTNYSHIQEERYKEEHCFSFKMISRSRILLSLILAVSGFTAAWHY